MNRNSFFGRRLRRASNDLRLLIQPLGRNRHGGAKLLREQESANLLSQSLQQSIPLIRVVMIAQKPCEPPPQPHPLAQQALRRQRVRFFNTGNA